MKVKTCTICKETKVETDFYVDKRSSTGRYSACNQCHYQRNKRPRKTNRPYPSVQKSWTDKKEQLHYYYEQNRERYTEYQRERYKTHNFEARARRAVHKALRTGELTKNPCEQCDREKASAHHDDYNFFLKVRWLCQSCHRKWHAVNKAVYPSNQ